ncbi:MAG: S-layer homology domain-containing protein [Clostridia bacterium]|nr:S-layer homology domain-containing protein [Clostridia bacterium]
MKLKKLLILLLTVLMLDLPAYKTDASNGNDMIALDDFESYGKTLSSPWASQGARSTGELSETQYGKSAILSSTSSAMHELIRSFSKTPADIKGNLLAFSMLFEDFSANRHVLIRRDGSSDDIYMFKIDINGKMSVGSSSVGISLETGKWYDFLLEHNYKTGFVRISVTDGKNTQVGEGFLAESARDISGVYRMEFVSFRSSQDSSVAHIDNVYMTGLTYGPEKYEKANLPETFDSFIPAEDGSVAPTGWSPRNLSANIRTATVEEFDNPAYGKALKLASDGGRTVELLKSFSVTADFMTVEFDMMVPEGSGGYVYVRGRNTSGSSTDATRMIQIDKVGNIYFNGTKYAEPILQGEWYHFKIVFDYASKTYTATIGGNGQEIVVENPFPADIVSVHTVEFMMPAAYGQNILYADNFIVYAPAEFGMYGFTPGFGPIGVDCNEIRLTFSSEVDEACLLGDASFALNGNCDAFDVSLEDEKTILLELKHSLDYDTFYTLEAVGIKGSDGKSVNGAIIYKTPKRYMFSNKLITPDADSVRFDVDAVSNDPFYSQALLIGTVNDAQSGKMAGISFCQSNIDSEPITMSSFAPFSNDGNTYVAKMFVWDSFETMTSLSANKTALISGDESEKQMPDISTDTLSVIFDKESEMVSVSGSDEALADKTLTLLLINPGHSYEELLNSSDFAIEDIVANVSETTASSTGKFAFEKFSVGAKSGYYSLAIGLGNGEVRLLNKEFIYISPNLEKELIDAFADESKTSEELCGLLLENAEALGFDEFPQYSDEEKSRAIELMDRLCETTDEIIASVKCGHLTNRINNAESSDEIEALIKESEDSVKLYVSVYSLAEGFDSEAYSDLAEMVYDNKEYGCSKDMFAAIGDSAVLAAVNNVSVYGQIEEVLKKSEAWLDADFSKFYKLSDKKKACLEIMKKTYTDTDSLVEAVEKATKKYSSESSKGSSGGGGSSPGFAGSAPTAQFDIAPTVTPDVPPIQPTNEAFSDLEYAQWAKPAIYALKDKNIISGVTDTTFAPNDNVTREQFVKMVVLALFSNDISSASQFVDCSESHWAHSYVSTAYGLGIVKGVESDRFGVGMNITRQDMAVMLYRAMKLSGIVSDENASVGFADSTDISDYAKDAVDALSAMGIINGYDGKFMPFENATRAQSAKMIYEVLNRKAE